MQTPKPPHPHRVYVLYFATLLVVVTFGLLVALLAIWDIQAANIYPEEFPTLSDLLADNTRDARSIYIAFYAIFTLTAALFLWIDLTDETGTVQNAPENTGRVCAETRTRKSAFLSSTIFYVITTVYAILFLLLIIVFDNKTHREDHLLFASVGFVGLVIRVVSLFVRRCVKRTAPCYMPSVAESYGVCAAYTLNFLQCTGCVVCLICLPATGSAEFEYALVTLLSIDPFFQLLDYRYDTICEHTSKTRETRRQISSFKVCIDPRRSQIPP